LVAYRLSINKRINASTGENDTKEVPPEASTQILTKFSIDLKNTKSIKIFDIEILKIE
jgi:hypothetical protein